MKYADHHGFPIITLIDTPGAYADLKSEELGQVGYLLFEYSFQHDLWDEEYKKDFCIWM